MSSRQNGTEEPSQRRQCSKRQLWRAWSWPLGRLIITLCFLINSLETYGFVRSETSAGTPTSWFTQCIPIWLNEQESLTLSWDDVESDLQRALAEWEGVDCADLAFLYQGATSLNTVGFDPTPDVTNQNIVSFVRSETDWLTDPLAVALTTVTSCQNETDVCAEGTTIDADIQLNEAYFVFTSSNASPSQRRMDLQSILTHELGHLIGLDHPPLPEATMYMSSVEGEVKKRDLARDDELGVCEIFPSGNERLCLIESYDLETGLQDVQSAESVDVIEQSKNQGCEQSKTRANTLLIELLCLLFFLRLITSLGRDLSDLNCN